MLRKHQAPQNFNTHLDFHWVWSSASWTWMKMFTVSHQMQSKSQQRQQIWLFKCSLLRLLRFVVDTAPCNTEDYDVILPSDQSSRWTPQIEHTHVRRTATSVAWLVCLSFLNFMHKNNHRRPLQDTFVTICSAHWSLLIVSITRYYGWSQKSAFSIPQHLWPRRALLQTALHIWILEQTAISRAWLIRKRVFWTDLLSWAGLPPLVHIKEKSW